MQLPDEPQQVYSRLNQEDTARCQHAIALANAGQKQSAYAIFCDLNRDNPEDVTVLTWIAFTTPRFDEARRAIQDLERLEPDHPNLSMLRNRLSKMSLPVQLQPPQHHPLVMTCPYCHYTGVPRITQKISTGGWVTFVVILFLFFPLCWIGLLIKKDVYVCGQCGIELGDVRY